ncbi:P-loop containing nucleoside triphosphate hydrolase protein [Mycena capillaripes]|nr:P-loop containing nucleoside triphosphate hydrolase protein [Mycena capillaripes]
MPANFGTPTSRNPLAPVKTHKRYRSGYEATPKATPFKPYALNNPAALDPYEWTKIESNSLPAGVRVHSFQVEVCNTVLMCRGDCVLISPTGSGKSLTWTLPLAARNEGISLVITPFTSLGQEGEQRYETEKISSIFIYEEQNSQADYEKAAKGEMMVLYVCPETVESPSFSRVLHSESWRQRLSAIYLDEAHLVHQSHTWQPSYSRIYQLRNIVGHEVPLICLSATCPESFHVSLITYAGLHPDYHLINLGNF